MKSNFASSKKQAPFSYRWKNTLFHLKIYLKTTKTIPRILMIFLLYCTAFSLFLMGITLLQRKHIPSSSPLLSVHQQAVIQQGIARNVVRLHIIANSDSANDQSLKLMVRDAVIGSLQDALKHTDSIQEAKKIITSRMTQIRNTAIGVLKKEGYAYDVSVSLTNKIFPVKKYGDLTFPSGEYQALCIEIGKSKGHNWWCVLFPSLCFVNKTTATVPSDSKRKLKKHLTEEEYHELTNPEPRLLIHDIFTE